MPRKSTSTIDMAPMKLKDTFSLANDLITLYTGR